MELDQEKKNQLAQKLRNELARQKADELGVEITDLMERIADGKSSFVKKSEVYLQLDKQRQLISPPKKIRSLRDGQNSLALRILGEIRLTRERLGEISDAPPEGIPPLGDYPTMIQKLENRVNHRVQQLGEVENKIERIKTQDPVFDQAEAILRELREAREKRNPALTAQLATTHHSLLKQYETARKSLHPHLDEARQCRVALQKEYAQILKIRFRLQTILLTLVKRQAAERVTAQAGRPGAKEVIRVLALLQKRGEPLRRRYAELSVHCPAGHLPLPEASKAWDAVLPHFKTLVDRQAALLEKGRTLLSLPPDSPAPPQDTPPGQTVKRMAYTTRI